MNNSWTNSEPVEFTGAKFLDKFRTFGIYEYQIPKLRNFKIMCNLQHFATCKKIGFQIPRLWNLSVPNSEPLEFKLCQIPNLWNY